MFYLSIRINNLKMIDNKKLFFLILSISILFLFVYNGINYDPIQGYDAKHIMNI